jgi:N-methylhydantoinase A
VAIAKDLAIPTVIVPPNPGVTSALGCLLVDIQHDFSESYLAVADSADRAAIEAEFGRLEKEALERLAHEGVASADIVLQRTIDMMYQGQWRSLAVAAPSPIEAMAELIEAFHRQHEREYNYRRDEAPVGVFRLNLKAIGVVPKAELAAHEPTGVIPQPKSRRPVWFDDGVAIDTPVYERFDLPAGFTLAGPAVVEQVDSTVVIPPGTSAEVDKYLNIVIRVKD